MGEWRNLFLCKAMKLLADHGHGLIETRIAISDRAMRKVIGDTFSHFTASAYRDELAHRGRQERRHVVVVEPDVCGAGDLILAHGDTTRQLDEILAECRLQD